MKVLKFGGTSVGTVESLGQVKKIVSGLDSGAVVVVSALGGVTDRLLTAAAAAARGDNSYKEIIEEIRQRHFLIIDSMVNQKDRPELAGIINGSLTELSGILYGVSLLGELSQRSTDLIVSYGERMSYRIVAAILGASHLFSPDFIKTRLNIHGKNTLDSDLTATLIRNAFANLDESSVTVVPGFISSDAESSVITNLGRGGSDYTAALIAAALDADVLEIWTDVDGFLTADPRAVQGAYVIDHLTYIEAMELCNFGAKVIYPPTIHPAFHKNIPLKVKNTFNPSHPGTLITANAPVSSRSPIRGISSINDTSLVTVEGLGMVGIVGINARIFTSLARRGISVFLVSQASSENNTSFAVRTADAPLAITTLKEEFAPELQSGEISVITAKTNLATVAVVGENMKGHAGIAGKLFGTLGRGGVNVISMAQGASQINISFVIEKRDLPKTLRIIHDSLFLSETRQLNLFVTGIGNVGAKLLNQIAKQQEILLQQKKLKINLIGVANSRKALFNRDGIDISDFRSLLEQYGEPASAEDVVSKAISMDMHNSVLVDCTASEQVASQYLRLLQHNVNVVAANKIAASSEYSNYLRLKSEADRRDVKFLFETNVGAGLPVISTLNNMVNSGDTILAIEAIVSGTLNYIFDILSPEIPFSKAVRMAKEMGYSEPDPRIDLSGKDVARKIVILAREAGYKVDVEQVDLESVISKEYFKGDVESFFNRIGELDAEMERRRTEAAEKGQKLRFVATLSEDGRTEARLRAIGPEHPFYSLESSNNIIAITTTRYKDYPIIVKGYGAGSEVTAAGVFADIISIANIR